MGEGEFGPVVLGTAKGILADEEETQVAVKVMNVSKLPSLGNLLCLPTQSA